MDKDPGLPRYFHIGMPKSGSKFFYNLLKQHPDIVLNRGQKNFYAGHFHRGFAWYRSQFAPRDRRTPIDISPRLFMLGEEAAPRIEKYVDAPRFLLILRSPVKFVYSYYRMHTNMGLFTKEYGDIFKQNPSFDEVLERFPAYLERGKYYRKFEPWLQRFDLSAFKVIIFEDLVKSPQDHMDAVFDFFRLRRIQVQPVKESSKNVTLKNPLFQKLKKFVVRRERLKNTLKKSRVLDKIFDLFLAEPTRVPEEYREILVGYYREDVEKLGRLLGTDLDRWLE